MKHIYGFLLSVLLVFECANLLFAQWVQTNGPSTGTVNALAVSSTNIFAGTSSGGVFLSTDNGTDWAAVNTGMTQTDVFALVISGSNIFAGTSGGDVFRSTNNGTYWTPVNIGLTDRKVLALTIIDTNLFAATYGGGIFISTNNGSTWSATGLTNANVLSLISSGKNVFAGRFGSGVYFSSDDGKNWSAENKGLSNTYVYALAVSNTDLYAGTYGGVFISSNNGTNWNAVNTGLTNINVNALEVNGANIFAGTWNGVFLLPGKDTNWIDVGYGLGNRNVYSLAVEGNYLFAGTEVSGIWMRPLSEMITGIKDSRTNIPSSFSLSQNYPNPFNPTTTIVYDLPKAENVKLKVYDILGRGVATLVDAEQNTGEYKVQWNGRNNSGTSLASGIYLYSFEAGSYRSVKKMIYLK